MHVDLQKYIQFEKKTHLNTNSNLQEEKRIWHAINKHIILSYLIIYTMFNGFQKKICI